LFLFRQRSPFFFLVDTLVICKLTPLQSKIYEHICTKTKAGLGKTQEEGKQSALASITHLKKLCNDPELVYDNYKVRYGSNERGSQEEEEEECFGGFRSGSGEFSRNLFHF
jgi:SNF2 family DNA or RNA helicase